LIFCELDPFFEPFTQFFFNFYIIILRYKVKNLISKTHKIIQNMEQTQNKTALKDVKANIIVLAVAIVSLIVVAIAKNLA
jgi:hypothetical protein